MRKHVRSVIGLAWLLTATLTTASEPRQWHDEDHSYDKARRAVERGDALPIEQVLRRLRAKVPGDVVSIEYEFEFHQWVYEFKVVDSEGRIRKVHFSAATGEMINEGPD